jgi:hypothetical protein
MKRVALFVVVSVSIGCAGADDVDVESRTSALSSTFAPYMTIPVYFGESSTHDAQWAELSGNSGAGYLILNRGSGQNIGGGGPGASQSQALLDRIDQVRAAGWFILGYVDYRYDRDTDDIVADISNWDDWYGVDGIFFDVAERTNTQYDITKSYFVMVIAEQLTGYNIVFNWGGPPREHYVNCVTLGAPFGISTVRFGAWETSQTKYLNDSLWPSRPWINNYRADRFVHIIHDATSDGSTVSTVAAKAQARNASSVYMIDLNANCVTSADCNVAGTTCDASGKCVEPGGEPANVYSSVPSSGLWSTEYATFNPANSMSFPGPANDPAMFADCPGETVCSHDVCGQGKPLTVGCDSGWNDCVRTVCSGDAFCCNPQQSWDGQCVSEAQMWCGVSCPAD